MTKFTYTNSKGIKSLFEAEPLTEKIYSDLLSQDRKFLEQISRGEFEEFNSNPSFKETALKMLESHGFGKESRADVKRGENDMIMVVYKKTVMSKTQESESTETPKTVKHLIRSQLPSNKIRLFKKEKMQFDV